MIVFINDNEVSCVSFLPPTSTRPYWVLYKRDGEVIYTTEQVRITELLEEQGKSYSVQSSVGVSLSDRRFEKLIDALIYLRDLKVSNGQIVDVETTKTIVTKNELKRLFQNEETKTGGSINENICD